MEITKEKNQGINSRIDEKEKSLIAEISNKISECVGDIMQNEIGEKLSVFSGSIEDAENRTAALTESMDNLSTTINVIKEYDLVTKCYNLEKANDKINEASQEASRIFEDSKAANKKFTDDMKALKDSLEEMKNEYDSAIASVKKINDDLRNNINDVDKKTAELSSLLKQADDILKSLDEKTSNEQYLKIESALNESKNETKSELSIISSKVEELMKPKKAPAAHVAIIILLIIAILLQAFPLVYEFFMK